MNIHVTPEALLSIQWVCGAAVSIIGMRTAYQYAALRSKRRMAAQFAQVADRLRARGSAFDWNEQGISTKP